MINHGFWESKQSINMIKKMMWIYNKKNNIENKNSNEYVNKHKNKYESKNGCGKDSNNLKP
jgi:hypothetical protein